jgi:hypothetical protein
VRMHYKRRRKRVHREQATANNVPLIATDEFVLVYDVTRHDWDAFWICILDSHHGFLVVCRIVF